MRKKLHSAKKAPGFVCIVYDFQSCLSRQGIWSPIKIQGVTGNLSSAVLLAFSVLLKILSMVSYQCKYLWFLKSQEHCHKFFFVTKMFWCLSFCAWFIQVRETHGHLLISFIIRSLSQGCLVHFESLASLTRETSGSSTCMWSCCFGCIILNTHLLTLKLPCIYLCSIQSQLWLQCRHTESLWRATS